MSAASASRLESLTAKVVVDFPEYEAPPPDPLELLRRWLAAAVAAGVTEPRALALATADLAGRASTRIIAFTSISDHGVVFTTHSSSQKGREMAANPWASGLLYWRELGQQVSLAGPVRKLPDRDADEHWFARPRGLHPMSVVSHQSDPMADARAMLDDAERLQAIGVPLPRPQRFAAYRLEPATIEFWSASADRLHRRLRYDRVGDGWRTLRLQP